MISKSMQVALYKAPGTWIDKLIWFVTNSPYSHVELVIDGMSYSSSSRDGGVRQKFIVYHPDKWDMLKIDGDHEKALAVFRLHEGKGYDWLGAIKTVLPFVPDFESKMFCSELVAEMLGYEKSRKWRPADFAKVRL